MITEPIINLALVAFTCFILLYYLIRFVFRYKHEYESNPLCTSAVIFCLMVSVITTFVLPADIFLVSFVKEPDGTFKQWATNETLNYIDNAVFTAYYALYAVSMLLIFVIIPFLHFFNEESESNSQDRLYNAIKYTFAFGLLVSALLLAGAFVHIGDPDKDSIFNKIVHISESTKFLNAINMVLTIITAAGFLNITFYTASGLFSWPIGLILGTSSVASRFNDVNDREVVLRMRISTLQEKARVFRLSPREREQLVEAQNDLRDLEREEVALSSYSESWSYKLRKTIRPIQIVVGAIFVLLSILLVGSLVTVNVDRLLHGAGPKQGYVLLHPEILNPLQYIYVKMQDLVFIGPMPLLIVTCFLLIATISGIRNLGLWLIFARLHRVKVGRTQPQALLFFCITIMLTTLAFNMILYSMTTEYITFGNQNYAVKGPDGAMTVKPCTLGDMNQTCILSRTSVIIMRMMSQVWVFGAVFYWWSWAFVVVGTLSFVAYLVRGKRGATHGIISDQDEFED